MINLAMLLATGSPANAGTTNIATVNPNLVLVDNFEGWGTSLCWWANVVGGYANRSTYASLAFTSLELNIVRYNIGGGENPGISNTMSFRAQMQGFETNNGVWNWNADANQRWMLGQAVALGASRVEAFANSPPWWMTVSGSVTGSKNLLSNNLQTGYETNFASYLATVVSNLTVLDGIHFDFVTPMNEPSDNWQYGGTQEGCYMSDAQQSRMVNDLCSALNSQNIAAGVDAAEEYGESGSINDINGYGSSKSNVALITSHTYSANNPGGIHNLSVSLGKPAWVSEYGDGDATGLTMAQRIHDDITGAQVSAWIYWQVVDSATGWGFLKNPLNGNGNTAYTINEKFYVMEQFSRYIRPGFQIIGINDTNSLVAYNSTNQTLVIVAVNGSTNNLNVTYNLGSFATLPTRASAVQTSPSENLAGIAAIAVTNNSFSTSLVPQSVTTFVLTNVTPAFLAWYPFEGNAQDASGNGYNGTLSNGVTFVAGKIGAFAAQFNGSNN
jgi:O-glycosyl hydrolase